MELDKQYIIEQMNWVNVYIEELRNKANTLTQPEIEEIHKQDPKQLIFQQALSQSHMHRFFKVNGADILEKQTLAEMFVFDELTSLPESDEKKEYSEAFRSLVDLICLVKKLINCLPNKPIEEIFKGESEFKTMLDGLIKDPDKLSSVMVLLKHYPLVSSKFSAGVLGMVISSRQDYLAEHEHAKTSLKSNQNEGGESNSGTMGMRKGFPSNLY